MDISNSDQKLADSQLREKLVAALLNAKQVSPAVQEYFDVLNTDFLNFTKEVSSLREEAATLLSLQKIGEQLKLISTNPDFYNKTVIGIAGGFSAGKSAFINSLIKDKNIKLATNINPTTAIPTYVLNGENQIKAVSSQGGVVNLDKIDPQCHAKLSHQFISQFGFNLKDIMPQIFLSTPMHFEHICFIDTPGYDPAVMNSHYTSSDKETAETFAQQADALIWVIGLDSNGTIPQTDLNFLQNIVKQQEKPIYVVLNKADLRPPSDIEDILETVVELLEDDDIPVKGVCAYSSLDNEEIEYSGTSLWQFLKGLNKPVKKQDVVIKQLYEVDQMYQKAILLEQKEHKKLQTVLEDVGFSLLLENIDAEHSSQEILDSIKQLYNPVKFNNQLKALEIVIEKLRNAIEKSYTLPSTLRRVKINSKDILLSKKFAKINSKIKVYAPYFSSINPYVDKVHIKKGDFVKKGDLLLTINGKNNNKEFVYSEYEGVVVDVYVKYFDAIESSDPILTLSDTMDIEQDSEIENKNVKSKPHKIKETIKVTKKVKTSEKVKISKKIKTEPKNVVSKNIVIPPKMFTFNLMYINKINVLEGEKVTKGQVLMVINETSQVKHKANSVTQSLFGTNSKYTNDLITDEEKSYAIKSPFEGRVAKIYFKQNDEVAAGDCVVMIEV